MLHHLWAAKNVWKTKVSVEQIEKSVLREFADYAQASDTNKLIFATLPVD